MLINNFVAILHNLIEERKTLFEGKISLSIDSNIKWEEISNSLKINLYRIVQEGLQNIIKYANASNIKIDIKRTNNTLNAQIIDDGVGFSVSTKKKGIGIQNMISRAQELEGTFEIKSKKEKGTTLVISFPI